MEIYMKGVGVTAAAQGCRCRRLLNKALTSSRTSASLLRISSCRLWNVGTLQEEEEGVLFRKRRNDTLIHM